MMRAIAETANCAKYLDMPLQHAHQGLLKAMARGGSRASFMRLLDKVRSIIPGIHIRSNFIVGFPGEDEAAFGELKAFIQEARFDHVGVFTYSPEEGTPAYDKGDPIPKRTKEARKKKLLELQQRIAREKNQEKVGQIIEVLVEGAHEETDLIAKGRHQGQAPEIDGNVLIVDGHPKPNTLQRVKITQAHAYDLVGEITEGGTEASIEAYEAEFKAQTRPKAQ
jgi:ribosomal protein S12 methylthiotransferase